MRRGAGWRGWPALARVALLAGTMVVAPSCGMNAPSPSDPRSRPGPDSGIRRRAPATTPAPPAPLGLPPAATLRAIAIAEDQRRYADGELRKLLADRSPAVRARTALAVGRLQDSTAVSDLLPLLADPSAEVRREAVFALGQIGHRSARAAIEPKLKDTDAETVELAIEALGKLGDQAATPAITPFLQTGTVGERGEAAVALWRLADSTALPALLNAHGDPDPQVRWRVLYALEKQVSPQRVVLVAGLHLSDPEVQVRAQAVRTMGRQKSMRATAYLMGALRDRATPVVVNAIRALQLTADSTTRGLGPALARALGHPDPYVRAPAATALAERFAWVPLDSAGRAAALDSLRTHLRDTDAATRGACARALLMRHDATAWTPITTLLGEDPSVYTRTAILAAWPPGTPAPLREQLAQGRTLFERMTAADRLGELRERSAVARLRAGLSDPSALLVASCAGALATLGDSASVPALAKAWAEHAGEADADARIGIRDALRDLAGRAYADSLERTHPPHNGLPEHYPPDFATPPTAKGALLHTTAGEIEWAFDDREAPQTVKNFVRLAEKGYFDGLVIHRVVPNFVIQDGDPTGTGSGGPGYTIRCEYNRLRYGPGMVGMALSGKDTGGSQWFITHSPQPHLNGRYTIFAHVVRGLDVVSRIVQGDQVTKVDILR